MSQRRNASMVADDGTRRAGPDACGIGRTLSGQGPADRYRPWGRG